MITDPNKRPPIKAAARKSAFPINLKLPATADLFINISTTRERNDHHQIIKLLGVKAVLLRIKNGTKGPERSGWQKTTFDQTCLPKYQRSLELAETIGVLLGTPSEGLCSIDFDDDAALKEFLIANPNLENSLRTKGLRGANIWIIVEGEIPRSRKLTSNGNPIGEWRANGAHTIIAGKHPEGVHYSIIVNAAPIRIRYSDIVWPWSCSSPLSLRLPPPSSELSVSSVSLHNKAQRGMNAERALLELRSNPSRYRLYRRFIELVHTPEQGSRNSSLVAMIPFLLRAVGEKQLEALTTAFYDTNQDIFIDPREQHLAEAKAHTEACKETWRNELSEEERSFVDQLPQLQKEAYRICRDLAQHKTDKCGDNEFFLTCNDLGDRLGIAPTQAQRTLQALISYGSLKITEKGAKRVKGERGKATVYRWLTSFAVSAILLFSFRYLFYPFINQLNLINNV